MANHLKGGGEIGQLHQGILSQIMVIRIQVGLTGCITIRQVNQMVQLCNCVMLFFLVVNLLLVKAKSCTPQIIRG